MHIFNRKQDGASLVTVLVAIGIIAVFSVLVGKFFKNNLDSVQHINDKSAAEDLRQYIRMTLDCSQTQSAAPATCTASGTPIALLKAKAGVTPLVQIPSYKQPATVVGKYSLKAYCYNSPKNINVTFSSDNKTWTKLFDIPIVCP